MPRRGAAFGSWGAPATPFAPSDETGLWQWSRADSLVLSNDDPVATWADSGSGGHDLTQASSDARPLFKTNVVNGLPALLSDGGNDIMDFEDMSALTAAEIFVVLKHTADPPTLGAGGVYSIGTSGSASHLPFTDGTVYDDFGATVRKTTVNPTDSMASWCIYSAYSAANDWANYLNGVQLFSTGTNTVGFSATPTLFHGPGAPFDGHIAEVIVYDHKLSSGRRTNVINYLKSKYAIV